MVNLKDSIGQRSNVSGCHFFSRVEERSEDWVGRSAVVGRGGIQWEGCGEDEGGDAGGGWRSCRCHWG